MENHQQHVTVHAAARQAISAADPASYALGFFDAHIQEHLRLAGAQASNPPTPYAQGQPGQQASAPAPQIGSSVAGGVGDVMGKQRAEQFAGMGR
jgi:hypothetical protein